MAILKYKNPNYVEGSDDSKWIPLQIIGGGGDSNIDLSAYATKTELNKKQDVLVSGTNIKTVNGESILGNGDLTIESKDVDLTNYYTKDETYTQEEVNELIDGVSSGNADLTNYYTKSEVDSKIPTDYVSDQELSDKNYATQSWVTSKNYITSSDISKDLSDYNNDVGYITSIPAQYVTETELSSTLSSYAKNSSIPKSTSDLTNDSNFITASDIPSEYITETELTAKGYLTSADLEDAASPIVRSYNEFYAWTAYLNTSTSALEILLYGNMAMDPLNNYSEVFAALKSENKIIHIGSESLGIELVIHPVKMEGSYNSTGIIHGRIKDTTLSNQWYQISGRYSSSLSSSASYASTLYIQPDSYVPVDVQQVTYSQLKTYADNGKLIPGRKYAIIDYSCIYIQPVSNVEMEVAADDIEQIICTATSSNTLDENVTVKRSDGYAKIIECRYSIDPEIAHWTNGMTSKTPKGVIYHMKDEYENEASYDFKHVKFRRWAITDISANLNAADGSKNNESPYRFKANANSSYYGSASNERFRVGSGQSIDETLVTNIFNGTWSACTTELASGSIDGSTPYEFTTTYAKNCHKPYTRTEYTTDKYLAWQTDMNGTNGLSYSAFQTYGAGGLSKVTTSTSYQDVYTFHYSGGDWSEIGGCVLNVKLNNLENEVNPSRGRLPNICFILSDGLTPNKETTILENVVINTGYCATFLIRDYTDQNSASMFDVFFNHVRSCLFIVWSWDSVRFNGSLCRYNYINADLQRVTIENSWTYNVIFGHLENIFAGIMQWNLWYNAYYYIQWNNSSSWVRPIDGYCTYHCTLKGYIHANILAPMQYCTFDYHINGNTFRNFYNKGVTMKSNKQGISFGRIAYSELEYGGGNYYADQILNCYFDCVAFYNGDYKFGNVEGWNPSRNKLPKMQQVYVCGGGVGHTVDYNTTIPTSWLNTELHPSNQQMGGKLIIYYDNSAGTYKKTDMLTMLKAHAS